MPRKNMKLVHAAAVAGTTTVPEVKQGTPSEAHVVPRPVIPAKTQVIVRTFAFESHAEANGGVKPRKPQKGHGRKKVAPDTPWSASTFQGFGIGMTSLAG